MRADDECLYMAYVFFLAGDGDGCPFVSGNELLKCRMTLTKVTALLDTSYFLPNDQRSVTCHLDGNTMLTLLILKIVWLDMLGGVEVEAEDDENHGAAARNEEEDLDHASVGLSETCLEIPEKQ